MHIFRLLWVGSSSGKLGSAWNGSHTVTHQIYASSLLYFRCLVFVVVVQAHSHGATTRNMTLDPSSHSAFDSVKCKLNECQLYK